MIDHPRTAAVDEYGGRSTLIAVDQHCRLRRRRRLVVTGSPSWPLVQQDFFDPATFWRYLPVIAGPSS